MWYNPLIAWLLRSPFHGLVSKNTMLVQYTGRKSGKAYAVPVNYVVDKYGCLVTISYRERAWWRGLHDAMVTLRLRGREVPARAEVLTDDEHVAEALLTAVQDNPSYQRFLDIRQDSTGQPLKADVLRAAVIRAAIRFYPQQGKA